jgi:hypothetical protein
VISVTAPQNGSALFSPASLALTAGVVANGHTITKVRFYNGATLLGEDLTAPFTWQWNGVPEGSYSVTARLYFDAGSTLLSAPVSFSVVNSVPTVQVDAPADGTVLVNPAEVTLMASAVPNGHLLTKVQFFSNGQWLGDAERAPYSWVMPKLSPGQYSLVARLIYDGSVQVDSTPVILTVQNLVPTIEMVSGLDGASFAPATPIPLRVVVNANGNDLGAVEYLDGGQTIGSVSTPPYDFNWSASSSGAHSISARLSYGNGQSVSSQVVNLWAGELPPPWLSKDIGVTSVTGTSSLSNDVFRISGAGILSGTADSCRLVYQTMSGDGEIRARILSTLSIGKVAGVGVMIRENLSADSRLAFVGIAASGEWRWERRGDPAGLIWIGNYGLAPSTGAWVRLVRVGNLFTGYVSSNGVDWTLLNSRTVTMPETVYLGLVVSSGSANTANVAEFSNVMVDP